MRKIALVILICSAISAWAQTGDLPANTPLKLSDGTYLFIAEDGYMRMVDKAGKPIEMLDDEEMELEDGSVVLMKNKLFFRHDHRKMKH